MLYSQDGDTNLPYWFARIMGIFHVDIVHTDSNMHMRKVPVLWVRWYQVYNYEEFGWSNRRLLKLEFVPDDGYQPYGFLDPNCVIRGVHIIPAFSSEYTEQRREEINPLYGQIGDLKEYEVYYLNW